MTTAVQHDLLSADADFPEATVAAAAIHELNQAYIDAVRARDADWFKRHMSDRVLVILGSGLRQDKAAFVSAMRQNPREFKSLTVQSVTVRVFGPIVQVDADAPWELADGSSGVSRYIDTWAWIAGRWQVISAQITPC